MRAAMASFPVPEVVPAPVVRPPALASSRVAVVTTAALHGADEAPPEGGDPSFRVITRTDGLAIGHKSPNFDRTGWLGDPNVILPLDRLRELADDGVIGAVAPRHLAFAG